MPKKLPVLAVTAAAATVAGYFLVVLPEETRASRSGVSAGAGAGALAEAPLAACKGVETAAGDRGDSQSRAAAHRGLRYLTESSKAWTRQHGCFGCHVQAVTMEALTMAKHHRYDVDRRDIEAMESALLLGVTAGGRKTGAAFQGQAWARYDQWVSEKHIDELKKYGEELLTHQARDGSVPDDDARLPITGGTMHTTYQAMQTWRQAYARTADEKWLAPIRRAETFLAARASDWGLETEVYLQEINQALLGLVAAGVGPTESSSSRLQKILLRRQNQDGGWGLQPETSDALATGQTIYALKLAGLSNSDSAIQRGMKWLVEHQGEDGAWRTVRSGQNGAEKGEGMWAVLGLVTMDIASITVTGLSHGQHVEGTLKLAVDVADNTSEKVGIARVDVLVDDRRVLSRCGASAAHDLDVRALSDGRHYVDVVATNALGQESRRRFEVYAGDVYMTQIGARYDEATRTTDLSTRNIAPASLGGTRVTLNVFSVDADSDERGKKVHSQTMKGEPGAMNLTWNGNSDQGKAMPEGRYLAELVMRDARGKVLQSETLMFSHQSESAARQTWAEIEGKLNLKSGIGFAAGAEVELVDEKGNVVQTVRSTEQGNYRFKSVRRGAYRVRAKKEGWKTQEQAIEAAPAAAGGATRADMDF